MEAEEGELRRGQLDLRRVDRGEDLVPELQLDRAPERRELALRRAKALQIVERLEDRLLVERGERAPVADRVRDEAREDEALRPPALLGAEVRRDELIDEQLGEAVPRDVDPGGAQDLDLAALAARDTEVERAATEVEHEREAGRDVRGKRRCDGLLHEPDVLETGEASRPLQAGACALLDLGTADELHRPADGRTDRPGPRELGDALEDPVEDERDEVLEPALVAEHVRRHEERIAEEGLQRLEEPPGRRGVSEDVRLDGLLPRIARDHRDAEQLELALHRPARAVVGEERVDRGMADERRAVAAHVEDARHRVAADRIDRQEPYTIRAGHRHGAVRRPEVEAEAQVAQNGGQGTAMR